MHFRYEKVALFGIIFFILTYFWIGFQSNDDLEPSIKRVDCLIEGTKKISCLKEEFEVYFPFKFIRKQFDVNGKWTSEDRFEYFTSYSKSKRPDIKNYSNFGVFGNFGSYNVEKRERVRCIEGSLQVPMSTQWQETPYFYPIQIAQFGLQHYSKLQTDPHASKHTISDVQTNSAKTIRNGTTFVTIDDLSQHFSLDLKSHSDLTVISFEWNPLSDDSFFSVELQSSEDVLITINYVTKTDARCLWEHEGKYYQSLNRGGKMFVLRDFAVDASKVMALKSNKKDGRGRSEQFKVLSIRFNGILEITMPIYQQSSDHKQMFLNSADWLLKNQRENGAWAVPVKRIIDKKLFLPAFWPSAMAQGHGISVLIRAYHLTNNEAYLHAARKALKPFELAPKDGGVRNVVLGVPWYEEYPTTPPTVVLNGFIYSLIGLYDLAIVENGTARNLFQEGLHSLKTLLPLYDTGSGSVYDLRHLFLKTPPNLARWDYHKVHVYLLKWLHAMTKETIYDDYTERWLQYSMGQRAKHN
ncbi:unnamed protein product [Bursaphelenchus okinawaensis]|uniref:heparosan-N-sulfate-glucuronate 5-epimerase n=1 Tax=Bursaphelenchus okinawaensis TaxID=465554 RepID=A0A811K7B6_9BILA|nr:unnamed protein product [Bursaphelenchus okinawaensis]CAG9093303.1 unnamed protein product [Bursaphelenchus okinawaensis]